jgi:hypothetical protein
MIEKLQRFVAWLMNRVRVNQIQPSVQNGEPVFVKRRRVGGSVVIWFGNRFLALARSGICMFVRADEWLDWEVHCARLLYPERPAVKIGPGASVIVPKVCGLSLRQLLHRNEAGVEAFDTLHVLRHAKRLPMIQLKTLAALLDFGACANAVFDNKDCCRHECHKALQLLEEAGIHASVVEYLQRLENLERRRPLPGGDHRRFQRVRFYREAVVRLSLGMVAATAGVTRCLDEGIRATHSDPDLKILFRIAMQCQIIDDVLDYSQDRSAGLPSFLTASRSLPQAFELTRLAALSYADDRDLPRRGNFFPQRSALFLVSTCTKLVMLLGIDDQPPRARVRFSRGTVAASLSESRMSWKS